VDTTPVEDAEIEALVTRLRAEFEATADGGAAGRPAWEPARIEAGRLAAVTGDRRFSRRPGVLGRVRSYAAMPTKVVVRKLVRWYVEPIAAEQRAFNSAVLRLVDDVTAWTAAGIDAVRREHERLAAKVDEIEAALRVELQAESDHRDQRETAFEDRLLRVERRPAARSVPATAGPVAAQAPAQQLIDYFGFETKMRQSRDEIRKRQARHVEDFRDAAPVLDVGCGRGEFLELLRDAGVEARGVDLDADMVAFCRGEGLDVAEGDALAYLEGLEDASLGGIFCAHMVEHLPPATLVRLLELVAAKLRQGGVFVAETPNPRTLVALQTFFADLTHQQPLHPETLAFLVRQAGLRDIETRFLNPPPDDARLGPVPLPEGDEFEPARRALAENAEKLNEVVFGPQDYAVVGRR
jgi:O-antigen chain-terminating methyltransferase